MDFSQAITDSLSGDGNRRNIAEQNLGSLREQNLPLYLDKLADEVVCEQRTPEHRFMAATMCKNAIFGKSERTSKEGAQKWLKIPREHRNTIKQKFLHCFASNHQMVRSGAAKVIAQFGCIELPVNEWPDLIEMLLNSAQDANPAKKHATLETLGMICEDIKPEVLSSQSGTILTTIVSGLAPGLPIEVAKAAINALLGSLSFIRSNFEKEDQRNFIMKVILEATKFQNVDIQNIALQCLVGVAEHYYEYIFPFVGEIFAITKEYIATCENFIGLQSIEFWSTICEQEILALDNIADMEENVVYHEIIKKVTPHLFPVLAVALVKQAEEIDPDVWNVSKAAVACVHLISRVIKDEILPVITQFVSQNITSPDWRCREAATVTFGSVLEYSQEPSSIDIIRNAIPTFIEIIKTDSDIHVKDSAAWTIAKAAEFHPQSIKQHLLPVLQTLVLSLTGEPNVAAQACYAIINVIQMYEPGPSSDLSAPEIFSGLLDALIRTSERPEADEFNLRIVAYECISTLVTHSPDDVKPIILKLVEHLVDRLNKTFLLETDLEEKVEFQNYLCSVLQEITLRIGKDISIYASPLMDIFFKVLDFVPNKLPGEPLMAVSTLLNQVDGLINNYLDQIKKYVVISLSNFQDTTVFISGLGLVGSLSSHLERAFYTLDSGNFCSIVLNLLGTSLQSQDLSLNAKPSILQCFGEIASAINEHFTPFLGVVMQILVGASKTVVDNDDEDMVDYLITLREAILETYTMIIQALRDTSVNELAPHLPEIFNFINLLWNDVPHLSDNLLCSIIGILGDISTAFKDQVRNIMAQPVVEVIVRKGLNSPDPKIQRTAKWTKSVLPVHP